MMIVIRRFTQLYFADRVPVQEEHAAFVGASITFARMRELAKYFTAGRVFARQESLAQGVPETGLRGVFSSGVGNIQKLRLRFMNPSGAPF